MFGKRSLFVKLMYNTLGYRLDEEEWSYDKHSKGMQCITYLWALLAQEWMIAWMLIFDKVLGYLSKEAYKPKEFTLILEKGYCKAKTCCSLILTKVSSI